MYTLSQMDLDKVLGLRLQVESNVRDCLAEEMVQRTLPSIAGLDEVSTDAERLVIFKQTVGCQLQIFVELNGSAFGEVIHGAGIAENHLKVNSFANELCFVAA